jgi:hypothetical protein
MGSMIVETKLSGAGVAVLSDSGSGAKKAASMPGVISSAMQR